MIALTAAEARAHDRALKRAVEAGASDPLTMVYPPEFVRHITSRSDPPQGNTKAEVASGDVVQGMLRFAAQFGGIPSYLYPAEL